MIEVIVCDECPFCDEQVEIMKKAFFDDEWKIINSRSKEFENHDCRDRAEAFPCTVIREGGAVRHAAIGVVGGKELRRVERAAKQAWLFGSDR